MDNNNYTKPNDPGHVDSAEDWLKAALVFAQALGYTLQQGEGIVLRPKGETSEYFCKKGDLLVIANIGSQIQILPLSDYVEDQSEFKEGMFITVSEENNED